MKTLLSHAFIVIGITLCYTNANAQALLYNDSPYGYEQFPTPSNKYRAIGGQNNGYQNNPPVIQSADSTNVTYKNDSTNAMDELKYYTQVGNTWNLYGQAVITYDTTDTHTKMISIQSFDFGLGMVIQERSTIVRDKTHKQTVEEINEIYDDGTQTYTNQERTLYSYDDKVRKITEENYLWLNNNWQATSKDGYAYDGDSKRIKTSTRYVYDPMPPYAELPTDKVEYTYNADESIQTEKSFSYVGQAWEENQKISYEYNDGKLSKVITELKNGADFYVSKEVALTYDSDQLLTMQSTFEAYPPNVSSFINTDRYIHTYDANKFLVSTVVELYNASIPGWDNVKRIFYTYNNGGLLTEYKAENWDDDTEEWVIGSNNFYYYQENTNGYTDVMNDSDPSIDPPASIQNTEIMSINMFPNPAQTELTIRYDLPEDLHFQIISIDGQITTNGKLKQGENNTISLTNLPSGQYLLTLKGQHANRTYHFIKLEQ